VILFWVICALLIVIALAFVLPPALQRSDDTEIVPDAERKQANIAVYRDQLSELDADRRNGIIAEDQYAQDREEIERRLLEDVTNTPSKKTGTAPISARNTAYLLGIGLPLVAIVFYLRVGEPDRITHPAPVGAPPSAESAAPPERTQAQIEGNVAKLAERLKSNPNDAQGWTMLARSYNSMEKYSEAANAYAKATELSPKDADLWAEYAFATGMAGSKSLEGKPTELINRALKVDPENPKALQLAGSAAFQAKDYNKAVEYWERVLKKVPPGSEVAETINERINEAKTLAASK
jgi:cytochrome c-type biogenesis protein CcmH